MNQSDQMLFVNDAYLKYRDMKQNDILFRQQFSRTNNTCFKNVDVERDIQVKPSSKIPIIDESFINRGGNAHNNEPKYECPNPYSPYTLNEYLIVPCPRNTYKNYLIGDAKKICSKSHQILNNWTKRKDIRV